MSNNKQHHEAEEPENTERWLLTYSDLITLLLIFFIVMYTMAKLDVAKYEVIKESLAGALKSGNKEIKQGNPGIMDKFSTATSQGSSPEAVEQGQMDMLEQKIEQLVQKYNLQNYIIVTSEERGLDIEIKNELTNVILFNSGSASLNPEVEEIMTKIGVLLNDLPENQVRVEGHTDNLPINTPQFGSNWELSTARSTNVLRLLINKCNVAPTRLSAIGYGEYKPVATNSTEEGRAKNRRVNIVIIRSKYNAIESKR